MTNSEVMQQLRSSTPIKQQIFIAALIHHLTILARSSYETEDAVTILQLANEYTHQLAGHFLSIANTNTGLKDRSISAIEEIVLKLHPEMHQKLGSILLAPSQNKKFETEKTHDYN
jgi:hypothetical protein